MLGHMRYVCRDTSASTTVLLQIYCLYVEATTVAGNEGEAEPARGEVYHYALRDFKR